MLTGKLGMEMEKGDHRRFRLVLEGRTVARTFVSTGSTKYRTLGSDLVAKMARQLHVTAPFFTGLVQCSKGRDDYLRELRVQGLL